MQHNKKLYLIDGSGFIFRAFHSSPLDAFRRSDGIYTNAVAGYCSMLMKLIEKPQVEGSIDYIAVIFDAARKTFRNDIYPQYKANREAPPEELVPQFELIREATRAFNLPAIQMEGYEADDLIATYTNDAIKQGLDVVVVSSDKDLMQLVKQGVTMFDPMKEREINEPDVLEKFGVIPSKVVDVQSLAGDSSDNVPGVPGIGVKTAALLINEYGDLDSLLSNAENIKQPKRRQNLIDHADLARISRQLVTLKSDVVLKDKINTFSLEDPDPEKLISFLKKMEFRTLTSRIESRLIAKGILSNNESQEIEKSSEEFNYELIQEEKALNQWLKDAYKEGIVAIDTETTSLNSMEAELVGFSLSTAPGRACYVPVAHTQSASEELKLEEENDQNSNEPEKQFPIKKALSKLKSLLENPSVLKVAHNAKYDLMVLSNNYKKYFRQENEKNCEIVPTSIDDTMLLSYVLDGGRGKHNLDDLALRHLNHETIKYKDLTGSGKKKISFAEVPIQDALNYAAEDADITIKLHQIFKRRLAEEHMNTVYQTIERPLISVIIEMERNGVKVDTIALKNLSKDFAKRTSDLEKVAHSQAGEIFNIGSPKQLGDILFKKLRITGGKKGKTGAFSTGADVLEELSAQGHDLAKTVLDWRQLAKLKSTYTDALINQVSPSSGRIHTSYGMAIAQTGRLSSNEPNLQNIPIRTEEGRKIRETFIAEKGHKLLSLDYSQIELRVLAHVAKIKSLISAFEDGQDIHAMTASQVFKVPLNGLSPDLRRRAKAINFGIIYGISAFGLARNLGISRSEAQDYIKAYFDRFPEIQDYMNETILFAKDNGYVETIFGRRIHLNGMKDKNQAIRGSAERQAINAPIQGAAADIIKRAMNRIPNLLNLNNLHAKMLLQVHDELLFEVPEQEIDKSIEVIKQIMERAAEPGTKLSVPLVADAGIGKTWNDAH
ncbi:MAG: DNA polymerase I [Alphaproteobacteria bacterium]|nr:DNA polymerase I [Alphaproteobacteria bacterium]